VTNVKKRAYDYVFDLPPSMIDRTIHIFSDETVESSPFTLVVTQEKADPTLSEENQIKKAIGLLTDSFPEFAMAWAQWMDVKYGRAYVCEFSWRSERGPMTQCQVYFPARDHVLCATFSRLGPFAPADKEAVLHFMHSYRLMPERAQ